MTILETEDPYDARLALGRHRPAGASSTSPA